MLQRIGSFVQLKTRETESHYANHAMLCFANLFADHVAGRWSLGPAPWSGEVTERWGRGRHLSISDDAMVTLFGQQQSQRLQRGSPAGPVRGPRPTASNCHRHGPFTQTPMTRVLLRPCVTYPPKISCVRACLWLIGDFCVDCQNLSRGVRCMRAFAHLLHSIVLCKCQQTILIPMHWPLMYLDTHDSARFLPMNISACFLPRWSDRRNVLDGKDSASVSQLHHLQCSCMEDDRKHENGNDVSARHHCAVAVVPLDAMHARTWPL